MTVAELIEKLREFPPNMEVFLYDADFGTESDPEPMLSDKFFIPAGPRLPLRVIL